MSTFLSPLDIANRALDHCGAERLISFNDQSGPSVLISGVYDKLRRAELRRNLWVFATRQMQIWAIDNATQMVTFPAWSAVTTYPIGQIVSFNNGLWVSLANSNLNNPPGTIAAGPLLWDTYFGPLTADPWNFNSIVNNFSNNVVYAQGDLVYLMYPNMNAGNVYVSLVENNQQEPDVVDLWQNTSVYAINAVVSYGGVNYQSTISQNYNNIPPVTPAAWSISVSVPTVSGSWSQIASAQLGIIPIVYPLFSGPFSDTTSPNAYKLPNGWLRRAPETPKWGQTQWMGAGQKPLPHDWQEQGGYMVSNESDPTLLVRFIADVQDVTTFDDMFCEGLACRIALEIGPRVNVLEGDEWLRRMTYLEASYERHIQDARLVDSIEEGPVELQRDLYATVRA